MMVLDVIRDAEERITRLHPAGSPGYTVPNLHSARVLSFAQIKEGHVPNLKIIGDDMHEDCHLIIVDPSTIRREVRLHVSSWTKNALVVLGDDLTVCGDYELNSSGQIVVLSGGTPVVGHSGRFHAKLWGSNAGFFVGRGSTTNGTYAIVSGKNRSIVIGDDCMLADGIHISTHDQHALMDLSTGEQFNQARNVLLEPHVWIGRMSSVAKGSVVGLGSIVGAHSLVTGRVRRLTAVGGVPARQIRSGVSWDRFENMTPGIVDRVKRLAEEVVEPGP